MKKTFLFTTCLSGILTTGVLKAQDQPHYSFYNMQQSIINPAAMTTFDEINGAAIFNAQMVGFDGAPIVGLLDVGIPIGKTSAYVGVQINHDRIGPSNRTLFAGNFAYRIKIKQKHFLSFGLQASANVYNANYASVAVQDNSDPVFQQNIAGAWSPNFKIGTYYFTDNLYIGFNVGNILVNTFDYSMGTPSNKITINTRGMHFYLQAGWQKKFAQVWKFQPSVLFKYSPGAPLQIDINAQFVFREALGFGVSYRTTSTLVAQVNYTIRNVFLVGYAANFGLSTRERAFFSGHELMLAFRIKSNRKMLPIDVPRF